MNRAALIERDLEEFLHKLLDVLLVNPGRAKAYINLGGIQILGLCLFQSTDVWLKDGRNSCYRTGITKLLTHIPGQVLVRRDIAGTPVFIYRRRQPEDYPGQL